MKADSTLKQSASEYTHTIDGRAETSAKYFEVINPATGLPFALAPDASAEQLDQAVTAAQRAYNSWRNLTFDERRVSIEKFSESIVERADEIAKILTREQGKPLSDAKGEVLYAANEIKILCQYEVHSELIRADNNSRVELHYRPLGVVGAITPWNFPILLATTKIAHALHAWQYFDIEAIALYAAVHSAHW